ncbi:MAG: hypothetical protein AAF938_00400 [Myxococcota bacterium]
MYRSPGALASKRCDRCKHFVMSGMATDMSGGTKGYCLHWTNHFRHVVTAWVDHSCRRFVARRPYDIGVLRIVRVIGMQVNGSFVFKAGRGAGGRPPESEYEELRG